MHSKGCIFAFYLALPLNFEIFGAFQSTIFYFYSISYTLSYTLSYALSYTLLLYPPLIPTSYILPLYPPLISTSYPSLPFLSYPYISLFICPRIACINFARKSNIFYTTYSHTLVYNPISKLTFL